MKEYYLNKSEEQEWVFIPPDTLEYRGIGGCVELSVNQLIRLLGKIKKIRGNKCK